MSTNETLLLFLEQVMQKLLKALLLDIVSFYNEKWDMEEWKIISSLTMKQQVSSVFQSYLEIWFQILPKL